MLDMSDLLDLGNLRETPGQVGRPCAVVTADIASELGIPDDAVVAFGLIDAEAGALGVMGKDFFDTMDLRLMLIGGTSTNYMTFSSEKRLIPGIWGPFKDAVFADIWMHEGGQSLSGAALDAVLDHHPAGPGSASSEHHRVVATHVLEIIEREEIGRAHV